MNRGKDSHEENTSRTKNFANDWASMYRLIYDNTVQHQLHALPRVDQQRIIKKILESVDSPHHFFDRLKGRPEYKLRVGDYRIMADIDDARRIIMVKLIGHRKNIYD